MRSLAVLLLAATSLFAELKPLLVISVDGLDNRYLRDRDAMGLKIPHLRAFLAKADVAVEGVTGVFGTVTWPSHTSMITGVRPVQHGILNNKRPASEGGDYYWTPSLLKAKTLWQRVREAGGKTSAITWPVTADADIDYNLPEYFKRRNGGAMDLDAITEKSTPRDLVAQIRNQYPSFGTEWMDDRNRTLATMYIVSKLKPQLTLLHLVDLDSEQHERGPFTPEAKAMLEYTDELIGRILAVTPKDFRVAIVSDHGFELTSRVLNANVLAPKATVTSGAVIARDEATLALLEGKEGIGRRIPLDELKLHAPELAVGAIGAFEPAPGVTFGRGADKLWPEHKPRGEHGLWPGRPGYRSVYLVAGPGIAARKSPAISMLEINGRFEKLLGIEK
jgi:predicted AlkP superfamily pyrophosphatase or phosphodiesterase